MKTMAGLNLQASEEEVVGVTLADKPGTLSDTEGKLGSAGINITINHGHTGAEGAYGALPVMKEVKREAKRRNIELLVLPTVQALEALNQNTAKTNAVLHVTC